ncbi:MAG: undecaprenyl-phosphate glucose phosphotransferase [Chloroflexota bacterium]
MASSAADFQRLTPVVARRSSRVRTLLGILLFLTDVAMLTIAFILGYLARFVPLLDNEQVAEIGINLYLPTMILHVVTIITIFYMSRLYHLGRAVSRIDLARNIFGAVTIGAVLAYGSVGLIFNNTQFDIDYPRTMFFYVWLFSSVFAILGREAHQSVVRLLREHGYERVNLLILGTGKIAREIARKIKGSPMLGYNIVGVVNGKDDKKGNMLGIPILGSYHELPYLIDAYQIEQVIIAIQDAPRAQLVELVNLCQRGRVDIKIYPDMFAYMAGDLNVDDLGGTPLLTVRDIALRGWKLSLKRGMDIVVSALGLIFLSPLMLLTALLIRLESPGSVFYTQERMGLDGRPFQMIKFRSMRQDAEATGPGWTVENDPRRTRTGAFMRKTNWDEVPQLINVLLGEMSLVGPRPERPVYVQEFRERIPRYMERHREKAGMTGWAQVNGLRGDTSIAERTAYDLWYVENWSLWLDIKIIIRTIWQTLLRREKNAY